MSKISEVHAQYFKKWRDIEYSYGLDSEEPVALDEEVPENTIELFEHWGRVVDEIRFGLDYDPEDEWWKRRNRDEYICWAMVLDVAGVEHKIIGQMLSCLYHAAASEYGA